MLCMQVCQEFNTTWAWELEQNGYQELTSECKTGILKVRTLYPKDTFDLISVRNGSETFKLISHF